MNFCMVKDLIKWIGVLTIVLGFIIGILEGNAYESVSRYNDSFGWAIAITWIFTGIVSGALFLAISEGLGHLELIAYNTSYLRKEDSKYTPQSSYPNTGKTGGKPSLESLSKSHTFKSLD